MSFRGSSTGEHTAKLEDLAPIPWLFLRANHVAMSINAELVALYLIHGRVGIKGEMSPMNQDRKGFYLQPNYPEFS